MRIAGGKPLHVKEHGPVVFLMAILPFTIGTKNTANMQNDHAYNLDKSRVHSMHHLLLIAHHLVCSKVARME
jgi:hypothetical protein